MEDRFLSRYTPSLMTPEALEAVFVQREELLQEILERVRTSVLASEKKNTLLVGPRGIGKTHLISLIYYRLLSMEAIRDSILVAWMREEEWGITCYRDLLFRILRALIPDNDDRLDPIHSLPSWKMEIAATALIRELIGNRSLVILVENLDDLIQKLGSQGEIKFYDFLQQNRSFCMVATSPGPVDGVLPQASPFRRNFFWIKELRQLDFEDSIQLISKIAKYQGNQELASLVNTARGRTRLRALRYLAGGNHRAYVIFAPLLTLESVDRLIKPLMKTIDDLTPYYNSRIATLPSEQRQILEYACEVRHPVRINDIARACFLSQETASSQLEALCTVGHLQSLKIDDAKYYELREPLMRLSFEVKKHRGKPIDLLLDFLRLWYLPAELKQKLSVLPSRSVPEQNYIPDLDSFEQSWKDPRISECCRDYSEASRKGDFQHALEAVEELVAIRGLTQDSMAQASCLVHLGKSERAVNICDNLIGINRKDADVWRFRASIFNRIGRYKEALVSCKKSIELDKDSGESWRCQASILLNLGRLEEAVVSCEAALKLNDSDSLAWTTMGTALVDLGLFDEAFQAFSRVIEQEPLDNRARFYACAALIELDRLDEALEQAQYAIELSPDQTEAWVLLGTVLDGMGKTDESLAAFDKAVSYGENSSYVQFKRIKLLFALDRWREGIGCLNRALAQFAQSENPNVGEPKALIQCLLSTPFDPRILQLTIKLLFLVYLKHRVLGALAQGLLDCIPEVTSSSSLSDEDAVIWWNSWETTTGDFTEFRLPLRLLDCAVRFRNTRDLGIFMHLPQEERTLLEKLTGVHVEAIV